MRIFEPSRLHHDVGLWLSVLAWMVAFACTYLALFVALWAGECRGAWKRIHTTRRETALIWQREKLRRGLAELRERKP